MPTYQYKCTKCGHEFEEFQTITESPISFCPECEGRTERVITGGAGFLFKGSGFYITDYRSEQYKKQASKDQSSRAGATGTSEGGKKETDKKSNDKKTTEKNSSSAN